MSKANDHRNSIVANTLWSSFSAAWTGFKEAIRTQRNFRIHVVFALAAVGLGGLLRLSAAEWCLLVVTIAAVLCLELFNTALESAIDLISPAPHPLARRAKDAAAAAVLVMAAAAVIIGVVLFGPRLLVCVGW
jgi:diacylglycerol kinase